MDFVRKYMTRLRLDVNNGGGDYDESILNEPTIGISPGQVKEDVHYMESRGAVDLSFLRFYADDNPKIAYGSVDSDVQSINYNDGNLDEVESFVDIAVFEVPEHCTSRNCDLSKFGVGSLSHVNGASYLSLCQAGRLQLNQNNFKGHHIQLMIPREGNMPDRIQQHKNNKFSMPESRHYEVMLANCHKNGRHIHVMGQVVFDLVDGEATVNNLTAESLTILISVAFAVFTLLTILAVRIRLGTRADFEQEQYGLIPDNDEGEQESHIHNNSDAQNNEGDDQIEGTEGNPEVRVRGNLPRLMYTTIV